jgi:hypothetical protein
MVGVSEYDKVSERDAILNPLYEKLTGNENNQIKGVL